MLISLTDVNATMWHCCIVGPITTRWHCCISEPATRWRCCNTKSATLVGIVELVGPLLLDGIDVLLDIYVDDICCISGPTARVLLLDLLLGDITELMDLLLGGINGPTARCH